MSEIWAVKLNAARENLSCESKWSSWFLISIHSWKRQPPRPSASVGVHFFPRSNLWISRFDGKFESGAARSDLPRQIRLKNRPWCTWLCTGARRWPSSSPPGRPIHGRVTPSLYSPASSSPSSTRTWKTGGSDSRLSPPPPPPRRPRSRLPLFSYSNSDAAAPAPAGATRQGSLRRFCSEWTRRSDTCLCWRSCRLTEVCSWPLFWGFRLGTTCSGTEIRKRWWRWRTRVPVPEILISVWIPRKKGKKIYEFVLIS